MNQYFNDILSTLKTFDNYHKNTVPLCAAENIMSDFVKFPLSLSLQERYIMNSNYSFKEDGNFIGAEKLINFYSLIASICKEDFNSDYTDSRTLTGMNCISLVLMSLTTIGDNVVILSQNAGGHASVEPICKRLGLNVFYAPYDYNTYQLKSEDLNELVEKNNIKLILLAPSDIIFDLDLSAINTDKAILIYDATQLLGLIQSKLVFNPLTKRHKNFVMIGATHKTMPGPSHGLILSNDGEIFSVLDKHINPVYLRNTQMHQIVSLAFCLIEQQIYGQAYQNNTVKTSNLLAYHLENSLSNKSIKIIKRNNIFSETHQIFLECSEDLMNTIYRNGINAGVTLNTKKKDLFHGTGIRLGVQEISRYQWGVNDIKTIAEIIDELTSTTCDFKKIENLKSDLSPKKIGYTLTEGELSEFYSKFS